MSNAACGGAHAIVSTSAWLSNTSSPCRCATAKDSTALPK